jgi:superfamily II DNA or RNA helicase
MGSNHLETKSSLRVNSYKISYDSYEDSPLEEFLLPSLNNSNTYRRAVGYFSSAILSTIPEAFSDFAERGGKIEIVCSPFLTNSDKQALDATLIEETIEELNREIASYERDGLLAHPLNLMAILIKRGCLRIKFAIPYDSTAGIFHQKIGMFIDNSDNYVAFTGSNNESLSGWAEMRNSESFQVYQSWGDASDKERADDIQRRLEKIWDNNYAGFEIVDYTESLQFVETRNIEDLEISEVKQQVRDWVQSRRNETSTSGPDLYGYQKEVINNWIENDYKGIVCFATGAGKTITALSAIHHWKKEFSKRAVVILVPTEQLQTQWVKEIRKFGPLKDYTIHLCGGVAKSEVWQMGLSDWTSNRKHDDDGIVIAVMATARKESFIERVAWGGHLLLVADEVHNMGAPGYSNLLNSLDIGGILGLSATPARYNDDENVRVREAFGPDLLPIVDIPYAQQLGVLVPYRYRFKTVHLTDDELDRYRELTKRIGQAFGNKESEGQISDATRWLNMRADVLKEAAEKVSATEKILRSEYVPGSSWLVFCNDSEQLRIIKESISDLRPLTFHEGMEGDQKNTLKLFERDGGILLSIKMLDEGVDIPTIGHCILVASSQNTRQYIQRRGRVLRVNRSKPKGVAEIWDTIVIDSEGNAFTKPEVTRAMEFARMAMNHSIEFDLAELISDGDDT